MTFISVAQATGRLGIDAKTLHRWLAEEELALQPHAADARKKGLSSEQLHLLAQRHQRRLTPLPSEMPPLPAALLALPERLDTLQAQLDALQQQVAELTLLLRQHEQEPVRLEAATKPGRRSKRSPKPTPPPPHARPAASATAKPPHKPVHVIPRVEYGEEGHYVVICPTHGLLPFEPETQEWFAWIAEQDSFRFVGQGGHFTAHHWWRVPRGAWRAHRHIRNHSYVLRLAPNHELTIAVLEQAAETLQAHLQ
jgi:hypothetical protein